MSDRQSAELFGNIFIYLAKLKAQPDADIPQITVIAEHIYGMTRDYDFSQYQMACDDELVTLGLAYYGSELVFRDPGDY